MLKLFLLLSLSFNIAFACASCQLMVPDVEVKVALTIEDKNINKVDIVWNFSDDYQNVLKEQYDKNSNNHLDKEELKDIKQAMMDYLTPKNILTTVQYADENTSEAIALDVRYQNFSLDIVEDILVFTYDGKLQQELSHNASLSIAFEDDEAYFTFRVTELEISENYFRYTKNLYLFIASILFQDKSSALEIVVPQPVKELKVEKNISSNTIDNTESIQESFLIKSMEKIKSLFVSIKDEKNPMTYLFLLFFAFVYGVIHALGPGHGKTLVASYFLSNDKSYSKAFFISLAIGVVHTFSAFLLTLIIYFFVNTFLAQFLDDTVYYTSKISALIIIAIALYLIYTKYLLYKKIAQENRASTFKFSTSSAHLSTCGCSSCKVDKDSTDIALIISAGIIPCPGTTTLFIFALSTGLYYAGFISALVMSLGMSSVIFISALLSTIVRKKVLKSNDKLKKYLEFISLIFILILGSLLLFV